ncbi:YbaN family protein [Planktotalea arctica]|uniref:YbaN family protein n=1 Tax=Planktotalea arctica TaxID=1481893 RepID=UPI000A16CD06|nr:YbaN family protein [Planktotalea arctica]
MKPIWFTCGAFALLLGALGVVLPVLPTTPFVILAAFAFGKSSPRLHAWLLRSRIFGAMIADWEAHGAIPTRVKWIACTMMAAVFLASLYAGAPRAALIAQAIGITLGAGYVVTRPAGAKIS